MSAPLGHTTYGHVRTLATSSRRWRVTWLDNATGAEIASEERAVAVLAVPTFARHVAPVLERTRAYDIAFGSSGPEPPPST